MKWLPYALSALLGALLCFFALNLTERSSCNVATQADLCLQRAGGADGWHLVEVQTIAGYPFVILERPRLRI